MMNFFNRIRGKLSIAFILVTLIPSLSIGIYSIQFSNKSLLNKELNYQSDLVKNQKRAIESFLSSILGDTRFLSESVPMKNYLSQLPNNPSPDVISTLRKNLELELLQFSIARKIYHQIRYLDENGIEIVRIDNKNGKSQITKQSELQNKFSRYYFQKSFSLPKSSLFVSPLDLNRERGEVEVPHKPVIRYAVPVLYPNGEKAGIVITNLNANNFLQHIKGTKLFDENGYYLAHPDSTQIWGGKRDLNTKANFILEYPDISKTMGDNNPEPVLTANLINSHEQINIPGAKFTWTLVAQRPTADLYTSINRFQFTLSAILIAALIVALGLAYYLGTRITAPIERLTEMANKVSQGDLLQPVRIRDKSEIGLLGDAFERMRVSMVKSVERLRKKSALRKAG